MLFRSLRENRQNFVIRERIRQMGGARLSGRTSFAQMATKDREELSPEDQLVYDFIAKSGGMEKAVPAIERELKAGRARLGQASAARVDAFGRLPRGIGTPAEAATYEKGIDLQLRGRIEGLQGQQESLGEQAQDVLGSKVQRNLVAPIQDRTRDTNAQGRIIQAEEEAASRDKQAREEYHRATLRRIKESEQDWIRRTREMESRRPN